MKVKRLSTLLMIFVLVVIMATIAGVYAEWYYAVGKANHEEANLALGMTAFAYAPEEVLPDEEQDKLKENHFYLVDNILHHSRYGVNGGDKDVIHSYLEDFGAVYGNQNVSGGNLKFVLAAENSVAGNVQFMMVKISDTEYHAYTFSAVELEDKLNGDIIEVYKTIMVYGDDGQGDEVWYAPKSFKGEATLGYCQTDKGRIRSILVETWHET